MIVEDMATAARATAAREEDENGLRVIIDQYHD